MNDTETLYVVCQDCGEAFDNLAIAARHEGDADCEGTWLILPESVAM